MDWIKVRITTTAAGIDPVSGRLLELGISGIEIADKDDFKEFLEQNRQYWDYVDEELERLKDADTVITLYLSDGMTGLEQLAAIRSSMQELKQMDDAGQYGTLSITTDKVKDEDWSEIWKQYFHPIRRKNPDSTGMGNGGKRRGQGGLYCKSGHEFRNRIAPQHPLLYRRNRKASYKGRHRFRPWLRLRHFIHHRTSARCKVRHRDRH